MEEQRDHAAVVAVKAKVVEEARRELQEATAKVRADSSEECSALNRFNKACKELDAALAEMRKAAPQETDWGHQSRKIGGPA
jgi:hypothetical protein